MGDLAEATNETGERQEPLFENIDGEQRVTVVESLCMNCYEQGTTRILLTRIPHFREVIVMAFECPHCNFRNNEIQPAATIAERGLTQACRVSTKEDLNRQVVKSESATVRIPEIDFEIPAGTQKGVLTTIEGSITRAIDGLSQDQAVRKHTNPALYEQIEVAISRLSGLLSLATDFTFTVDDPSGNSYVENLCAPKEDPKLTNKRYNRTKEQDEALGLAVPEEEQQEELDEDLLHDVMIFGGNCSRCSAPSDTKMHMLDIPHFKEVVIMATTCDHCGYKSNEVKSGGAISEKGKRITLAMEDAEDLSRDILKSETCGLRIPEIDLEVTQGTLGGRFTTVEGLLSQVHDELQSRTPFMSGDSADSSQRNQFAAFLSKLKAVLSMEQKYTLILDDPLANSYLQNLYAPDPDPNMTVEEYERTWEQNEFLGLNDIKTEGYENDGTS
ncbi:ZPR1 zinc-finger domain-containing protein [Cladochytrium replicatum]|nr:ZPR1 zinc-finger domain-containing protein [Cladochytrium replicatum]